MFELADSSPDSAVIKVIGVGGGGGNAVKHMLDKQIEGVDFIAANTDAQALKSLSAPSAPHREHSGEADGLDAPSAPHHQCTQLQIGSSITKGLGAGANPDIGRQAALEDRDRIAELLKGADMAFVTAGMGGGTGTGAAPIVAQTAKELGILTVAVVTRPFKFEKRDEAASQGIKALSSCVDSLITVPNEKLLAVLGDKISVLDAFSEANNVLLGSVQGISELIVNPGQINVDFADVRTVMAEMGMAMMGTGRASGENRAREAADAAIRSPLLEDINLKGAKGILVNVTAGPELSIAEFTDVGHLVEDFASEGATVVAGTVIDSSLNGDLKVTIVATGLSDQLVTDQAPTLKVDNTKASPPPAGGAKLDYKDLEHPTFARNPSRSRNGNLAEDMNMLDIPAFLKRQVD